MAPASRAPISSISVRRRPPPDHLLPPELRTLIAAPRSLPAGVETQLTNGGLHGRYLAGVRDVRAHVTVNGDPVYKPSRTAGPRRDVFTVLATVRQVLQTGSTS